MTPRDEFSPYAKTIQGKRIYVYPNDHPPPHAHVRLDDGRDGIILFDLRSGDPLPGSYTRRALREWQALRPHVVEFLEEMRTAFDRFNPPREVSP